MNAYLPEDLKARRERMDRVLADAREVKAERKAERLASRPNRRPPRSAPARRKRPAWPAQPDPRRDCVPLGWTVR
jgi:hypothetical protein